LGNKNQFQLLKKIDNSIFVSSNHAIYEWTNTAVINTFEVSKFLQIRDFEILNNTAFVITKNKLIALEKNTTIQKNESPNIIIDKITVNDKTKSFDIPFQNSYLENKVVIHYNIINFDYFNEYEYYYELNNKKFLLNINQNTIDLPNLNSGNYSFQIYAKRTNESLPISQSKSITFEILPPFWKRLWFVFGAFALLTLTFYVIYQVKIKNIRIKNEIAIEKLTLENNLKESRLQLIKSQMNPHFFFNAINNIQSYIFTNETKEASVYLSKFSKLTRKILEFSEVNTVSLKEEIEALTLYLELQQMRFKDFCYEIKLENISQPERIKIPTMLFQPYIENAILHGLSHSNQDKKLEIKFHWNEKNVLTTTIFDNGIGRVKSAELNTLNTNKPKSFATKANLERIMLLNKDQYQINISYDDLYNENLESNGTLVTITIAL
jgi:sensor histidine kinase YesM